MRHAARRSSSRWPRRCATTPAASAPRRSATPSAGRSTPSACSTSARPRSSSSCSATSAGPAAASSPCAATPRIQGSTDIPTLYNLLPGYLPMPHAAPARRPAPTTSRRTAPTTGFWADLRAYIVSLLKAWWGDARDGGQRLRLRLPAAHHRRPLASTRRSLDMLDGKVKGFFLLGENPAVGSANGAAPPPGAGQARLARGARPRRDRDAPSFWYDAPEIETGELRTEDIGTEVFLLPAAAHTEKDGTLHQHPAPAAVAPQGRRAAGRRPLRPVVHLPPRAAILARSSPARPTPRDRGRPRPDLGLPDRRGRSTSRAPRPCCARSTATAPDGGRCRRYTELQADGSTRVRRAGSTAACYADGDEPGRRGARPAQEQTLGGARVGLGLAGQPADPVQPGLGRPRRHGRGRSASAYVWWDARRRASGRATTCPTSRRPSRPTTRRREGAAADAALSGQRAVHHAGRRQGLAVRPRRAASTARCRRTTSRTSRRSATRSTASSPTRPRSTCRRPRTRTTLRRAPRRRALPVRRHHLPAHRAPHRRRDEPQPSGRLAELQPEMFCEVGPELARARGLEHGGWATIVTHAHGDRGAGAGHRADRRRCASRAARSTRSACRTTGATAGWSTGDSANDLFPLVARPERAHPGGQGGDLRHPPPAGGLAGPRCSRFVRAITGRRRGRRT